MITANDLDPTVDAAFSFLATRPSPFEIDTRLREVMAGSMQQDPSHTAIWLRITYTMRDELQVWQPLLNAGIASARARGISAEDCFYGLMPRAPQPQMNTGQPEPGPHPWNAAIRR